MKRFTAHRQINNYLTVIVIVLAVYIFVLPFMPAVTWWVQHDAPIISANASQNNVLPPNDPVPVENTLVIPSINLRTSIHQGDVSSLSKGVWQIPGTSHPDTGGNTVLAGHRFTYGGNAIFYNLDKVKESDLMYVYWEGKRYEYIVSAIAIVAPTDGSLVQPTVAPMLTVYTCTPLWSAKERLVISAQLVEEHNAN